MKCDLCGCNHAHISTMKDIVHDRMMNYQIVFCPECGYRRKLNECHSESNVQKRDITMQEIERRKNAAYRSIEKNKATVRPKAEISAGQRPGNDRNVARPQDPSSISSPKNYTNRTNFQRYTSSVNNQPKTAPTQNGKNTKQTNPIGCLLAFIALMVAIIKLFLG